MFSRATLWQNVCTRTFGYNSRSTFIRGILWTSAKPRWYSLLDDHNLSIALHWSFNLAFIWPKSKYLKKGSTIRRWAQYVNCFKLETTFQYVSGETASLLIKFIHRLRRKECWLRGKCSSKRLKLTICYRDRCTRLISSQRHEALHHLDGAANRMAALWTIYLAVDF